MGVTKRLLIVVGVAIGGGLCAAAAAWACTPPSYIAVAGAAADANVGMAGTEVRITGGVSASDANPAPIELHWRASNGQEIQLLKTLPAQTSYGAFTTTVQVPTNASPGIYHIVAYAQNREDLGTATAAYKVVAPSPSTDGPTGEAVPTPRTDATAVGGSGDAGTTATAPVAGVPTASSSAAVASSPKATSSAPVVPGPVAAPAAAPTAPPAGSRSEATPGAAPSASPQAALSDGARPSGSSAAATPVAQAAGPSGRSTYDDLWSATSKATGLGLEPASLGQPSGAAAPLTLAIESTSAGLVLLAFGFALGEVRRRRVPVRT